MPSDDEPRRRPRRRSAARPRGHPQHLLRPDAEPLSVRAQSDHRRHGAADHRSRFRRRRPALLDHHRLSAVVDRGGAALRQALRHPRAAHHDAGRARPVHRGLGRVRSGAESCGADRRPHAAGHRGRRHRAAHPDHDRRHGHPARARPLPGLHGNVLDRGRGRRPRARRPHCRVPALVADLLAQRAARRRGHAAYLSFDAEAAAPRPSAPPRRRRRRADDHLGDALPRRAHRRRRTRALAVGDHLRADDARASARRCLRLAAAVHGGAVPAADGVAQPGDARRHRRDLLHDGRGDRAHRLPAALFPGRVQAIGRQCRPRADPDRGDDHARLDVVRALHDASAPLQDFRHHRRHRHDRQRVDAGDVAVDAALWRDRRTHLDRLRRRLGLSGRDRLDPECGAAASGRHRHRRHEFLPRARELARGRDHGRDPALDPGRGAAARSGHGDAD